MKCLGKLRDKDRELIERRYTPGETGTSLAEFLERPVNSVYQSLGAFAGRCSSASIAN